MQQIKNPYIRLLIHGFLILWVLYSVVPFIWAINGSFQFTRDAIARTPRYWPEALVTNAPLIAGLLALVIVAGYFFSRRQSAGTEGNLPPVPAYALLALTLVVVVGGYLLLVPDAEADLEYANETDNTVTIYATRFDPEAERLIGRSVAVMELAPGEAFDDEITLPGACADVLYSTAPANGSLATVRENLIGQETLEHDTVFCGTGNNYAELWLSGPVEDFIPVAIWLAVLFVVLIGVGVYGSRFPNHKTKVYFGIAAVIVGTVIFLPRFVAFAEFYGFFLNSVIVTVGTLLVSITIGCLAGYGLARYRGIAGVIILFAALAFRALPRLSFILPYYYFAQLSGLYDTYILLIITFVAINQPFTIWMLRSFFMDIPKELEEAAMIDGCNRLTAFVRVIIPIVWPGIITTALFTLLLAYNEFLLARLLSASQTPTMPVGISRFTSGEDARLIPLSNASAVSITLPIVLIVIFFQRYLIKGLAGGAIKG